MLNMNAEFSLFLPIVDLEECEIETNTIQVDTFVAQGAVAREGRLRELRKKIRTDHLNDQERRAVMNICEYYIDIFKLPGDNLIIEHALPTPGIDPCRGTAIRNYQIPEALKCELQGITDQTLRDRIIRHSNSTLNSPLFFMKNKEDASKKEKWRLVVDFRRLKEVTVGDSYPLPLISDTLGACEKHDVILLLT